ncbi:PKD domain-containing protein [Lacibacter sp. H375]|uniref:PKD domain-containing protein n=1 Tax=Lacibacter sp. H375 TaxID=3133424 RepID=UPI0030C34055
MKRIILIVFTLLLLQETQAGHISGGEMYYAYVGPGPNGGSIFRITLRLFRDCNPLNNTGGAQIAPLPSVVTLGVFNRGSNTAYIDSVSVSRTDFRTLSLQSPFSCIINAPPVCYEVGLFSTTIELPNTAQGYTVAFETCCRINGLSNVSGASTGSTYVANIPGTALLGAEKNSSPVFDTKDTALVCRNKRFVLPFSATDPDLGDSLSYSFCEAYDTDGLPNSTNRKPLPPPYNSVGYTGGYSGASPLGSGVTIHPVTGVISGVAPTGVVNPSGASFFVVNVCVTEWRRGVPISVHRKDFTIRISDCDFADAELPLENRTCDGFTQTFQNLTPSTEIKTWFWDFGVGSATNDTSNQSVPSFTYADTGVYKVMLIVNRGNVCTDTSYSDIYVFPGFFPDFNSYDGCKDVPIQFTDNTTSVYGVPNSWKWNFGNPATLADTSRLRNPQYTYPLNGTYNVQLIAGSTKGCLDTITKPINITDKPTLQLTNDTLICSIDTLQLNAFGQGTFQWSPAYNINNQSIANPLVSPDVPTKYYVTLTLAPGCFNTDSVLVNVVDFVTLRAPNDTTICRGDTVVLKPSTDGLQYAWSPPNLFIDPNVRDAVAIPTAPSTVFTVVSTIGKCNQTRTVTVNTVPYPLVNAGPDDAICYDDTLTLTAVGDAENWLWSPASTLGSPTNAVTTAFPLTTTNYILRGTSSLGCPKPVFDTVQVRVVPPVPAFAGNDTAVVVGQPLQLNGSGGTIYQWIPPDFLNDPFISDPLAIFDASRENFSYIMRTETPEGCFAFDTINIRIFKISPDILVPTGFTPDGNNLNDVLTPYPVGIAQFHYFRVFNRWGQEIFATTKTNEGWDGTFKSIQQDPGAYVWMVSGTDYLGRRISKKGTVVLIR